MFNQNNFNGILSGNYGVATSPQGQGFNGVPQHPLEMDVANSPQIVPNYEAPMINSMPPQMSPIQRLNAMSSQGLWGNKGVDAPKMESSFDLYQKNVGKAYRGVSNRNYKRGF